jgi:hypothetical protein
MNTKKIFILGAAHSGTTILYRILAYHPDLAWFSQFSIRDGSIPGRTRIPFTDIYKKIMSKLIFHKWQKRDNRIWIPRPGEVKGIWNSIWEICDLKDRKKLLIETIEKELKSWGKMSILIKNPWLGFYADNLYQIFQDDVYFIHIIRDGRAVVLSDLHKYLRHYSENMAVVKSIDYWNEYMDSVAAVKKQMSGKRFFEIRYEDFVSDIPTVLYNIFEFLDLDQSCFPMKKIPASLASTNPKWINDKYKEEIKIIEKRAAFYLKMFRYI